VITKALGPSGLLVEMADNEEIVVTSAAAIIAVVAARRLAAAKKTEIVLGAVLDVT